LMHYSEEPSNSLIRRRERIRKRFARRISRLKSIILELTGKRYINHAGRNIDIWDEVIDPYPSLYRIEHPLLVSIQAVDEAITEMKADNEIEQTLPAGEVINRNLNELPWRLSPYFERATKDFKFQGHVFRTAETGDKGNGISKRFKVMCTAYSEDSVYADEERTKAREIIAGSWNDIGMISLQPLPDDRSLFIARFIPSQFDAEGVYFNSYLEQLLAKFQEWGINESTGNSLWDKIKSFFS